MHRPFWTAWPGELGSYGHDSCAAKHAGTCSIARGYVFASGRWRPFVARDNGRAIAGRLRLTCRDSFSPISFGAFPSSWALAIYVEGQVGKVTELVLNCGEHKFIVKTLEFASRSK